MTLLSKRHPVAGDQRTKRAVPGWAVLAVCCLAQFMVVLDISIVNVALPQMKSGLHLSTDGQQWVINAYTLTFAGLLMLGGRAADLFGRRRVFLIGLGLFTGFSLLGGLAQDGAWLLSARALQGASGAVLAPATLSLLTTSFRDPAGRRRALGAWSATAASGAAMLAARLVARLAARGQLVIGLLLEAAGLAWMTRLTPGDGYWPSVFLPELLTGTGFGLSFLPMTLGATTGVPPQEAGLASGLLNTTRQVGGAIGLAATATAAAAVHAHSAVHHVVAAPLTSGYDRAFGISAVVLVAGALIALLLPARLGTAQASISVPERSRPAKAPAEA